MSTYPDGVDPESVDWGLHNSVVGGELSIEEAWDQAQKQAIDEDDPDGIVRAVKEAPNTVAIDASDLPEDEEAFAATFAEMVRHIFEGPNELDIASDPHFVPFLDEITKARARIGTMIAMQVPKHEVQQEIAAWDEEHEEDLLGQLVVIQPIRKGTSLYYAGPNMYSAYSFPAQLGDVLEGRIGGLSLKQGGGILLESGVYMRERIDGRLLEKPQEIGFTYARIESLIAYDQKQPVQLPLAPTSFLSRIAITMPTQSEQLE